MLSACDVVDHVCSLNPPHWYWAAPGSTAPQAPTRSTSASSCPGPRVDSSMANVEVGSGERQT